MRKFYHHKYDAVSKCFRNSRIDSLYPHAGEKILMMNEDGNWHLAFSDGFISEKEDSVFADIYDRAVMFGNYIETTWPEDWKKIP